MENLELLQNKIIKMILTATTSYYLSRKISYDADTRSYVSYYNPINDKIVISVPNVLTALSNYDIQPNDAKIEEICRTLIYHECSHVLSTPKKLYKVSENMLYDACNKFYYNHFNELNKISMTDFYYNVYNSFASGVNEFANIFEDARIEFKHSNIFLKTNFKELIRKLNRYDENDIVTISKIMSNPASIFYGCARFQMSQTDKLFGYTKRIIDCIIKHLSVTSSSGGKSVGNMMTDAWNIYLDIFLENITSAGGTTKGGDGTEDGDGTKGDNNTDGGTKGENKDVKTAGGSNDKIDTTNAEKNKKEIEKKVNDAQSQANKESDKSIKKLNDKVKDSSVKTAIRSADIEIAKLATALNNFLLRVNFRNSYKGGAINAYIGQKVNPKLMFRPNKNNYKWFDRNNDADNKVGRNGKKRINLWLDASGSYRHNCSRSEDVIALMANLEKISNGLFDFNLIAIGGKYDYDDDVDYHTYLFPKGTYKSIANGGTHFNDLEMKRIYKELNNDESYDTHNVILIDGDIKYSSKESIKVFNNYKSHFIVDSSVIYDRDRYAPKASLKHVLHYNYPNELMLSLADLVNTF